MNFLKIRKARKELKEVLHYAKHVRHMHEDIADPQLLEQLHTGEKLAGAALKSGEGELIKTANEAILKLCEKVSPPKKHAKLRENVEVLVVAIAAAMAIRAYFFQPFKIPTGSMQPTLYGITVKDDPVIKLTHPLAKIAGTILFGERRVVIKAKTAGYLRLHESSYGTQLDLQTTKSQSAAVFFINNIPHAVPMGLWHKQGAQFMDRARRDGGYIREGEVLFDGVIKSGDYILVNRVKYNFVRPKRGDITVFDTSELTHPQVRKDAYYIKRMVGLPNETVTIDPPYLLVDGQRPNDPRFDKIFNNKNYNGYIFGSPMINPVLISKPGDSIHMGHDEFLFFGDNTTMSLDGRYFGAVNRRQILGPAFFVCWPLDRAGLPESSH